MAAVCRLLCFLVCCCVVSSVTDPRDGKLSLPIRLHTYIHTWLHAYAMLVVYCKASGISLTETESQGPERTFKWGFSMKTHF